jgi:hypothetical protein
MRNFICLIIFMFSFSVMASPAGVKNEDGSFKISSKSLTIMGIQFSKLDSGGPWVLPKDALVKIKFTQGVYRMFEGNITFVIVSVLKSDSQNMTVKSEDLEFGDEVAIKGTNFLRLTEADLNSETVDNCAH